MNNSVWRKVVSMMVLCIVPLVGLPRLQVALCQPDSVVPNALDIEVSQFGLEPVNVFNAAQGADTCMTVETDARNTSTVVQWLCSRRLVATKNGITRVLWSDLMPGTAKNPEVNIQATGGRDMLVENVLFDLRDVPASYGEITFLWDALAQPNGKVIGENDVSLTELNRAAQQGGVRLSRQLVLRRDGQIIQKPTFAAKSPLHVVGARITELKSPDTYGNDIEVALILSYSGPDDHPEIDSPNGLSLFDENWHPVNVRSEYDDARPEGSGGTYALKVYLRRSDLRGHKILKMTVDVSDGKSWPLHAAARATVPVSLRY